MRSKPKTTKNSKLAASTKKLLKNLHLIVADSEAHLYSKAIHAGEDETTAKTRIQEDLKVVRERLFSADSPVQVNTQQPAQYVHVNQWRSVGISACANLIVSMQNVRH